MWHISDQLSISHLFHQVTLCVRFFTSLHLKLSSCRLFVQITLGSQNHAFLTPSLFISWLEFFANRHGFPCHPSHNCLVFPFVTPFCPRKKEFFLNVYVSLCVCVCPTAACGVRTHIRFPGTRVTVVSLPWVHVFCVQNQSCGEVPKGNMELVLRPQIHRSMIHLIMANI